MPFKKPGTGTKIVLSGAGFLLFFYLIWRIGFDALWENLSRFGLFWFAVIILIGALWLILQTGSWSTIQNAFFQRVPFFSLYKIKIISDALNVLLPSASLGGDAARAFILRKKVPLKEGLAGVLFDKTIEFVASTVFLAAGLILGSLFIRLPQGLLAPTLACMVLTIIGIGLLVVFSIRGFYGILVKLTRRFPRLRRWILEKETPLRTLDGNLRLLYRKGNFKIAAAFGFHFLGRCVGSLEVFVILKALGSPVGFVQSLFIYVVIVIVNTIFFILPGQWGVSESASLLLLQSMGQPAALGLTLGVIRRIRKLVFVAVALAFIVPMKKRAR